MTKIKQIIKFHNMPARTLVANNGWISQWCCTCKTRHILFVKINKGNKETNGDYIEINWFQDNMGTKLRKFYESKIQPPKIKGMGEETGKYCFGQIFW